MAKTVLVIFGILIGVPMTVLHVWSIWGALFGKQAAPSKPEVAEMAYDEGGGFAGASYWDPVGTEESAAPGETALDLKAAA